MFSGNSKYSKEEFENLRELVTVKECDWLTAPEHAATALFILRTAVVILRNETYLGGEELQWTDIYDKVSEFL